MSADGSICGLTSYADAEFIIKEMGVVRTIEVKQNQILLDSSFLEPGKAKWLGGKRRFTLAHECAHQILFQMESEESRQKCRKLYSDRRSFSLRDLKSKEDWNEWQANALGAEMCIRDSVYSAGLKNSIKYFKYTCSKGPMPFLSKMDAVIS